mgnify:CR=1 FL=1
MAFNEFTLSVDELQNPKVLKDSEAIGTLLARLLLLEPGTIQSHPNMGVGLISKYRFGVEGVAAELQSDFQSQIEQYLPQFQGAKVSVKEKDKTLMIGVEIDSTLYAVYYDEDTKNIQTGYTSLSNL